MWALIKDENKESANLKRKSIKCVLDFIELLSPTFGVNKSSVNIIYENKNRNMWIHVLIAQTFDAHIWC